MDMLRTCYRAQMSTIQGGDAVPVTWYRTAPGALVYGATTSYRSRMWHDPPDNDGIGEQSAGRVCCGRLDVDWYNGSPPAGHSTGPNPCGTALVAVEGAGPSDPKFVTLGDGSAPCCSIVPLDCPPRDLDPLNKWGRWSFDTVTWKPLGLGGPDVWFFVTTLGFVQVNLNCSPFFFFMNIGGIFASYTVEARTAGYARFRINPDPLTPPGVWNTIIEWSWPSHP